MSRELRMVPRDWQHPKNSAGKLIPLFAGYSEDEEPANPADYMPRWPASECTHFQMYETCSEGTPISPVCESPESLAKWLADNHASAFGDMTATYEQWLATIKRGWAPSGMITNGSMRSGVEALADFESKS